MHWSLKANCELNYTTFGVLPQLKETIEPSTLTQWFDLSAKAKICNTKFCIQWGIMQD